MTEGAERLGRGDLDVKVPVPHSVEFARLAETFNQMALDLRLNQEQLVAQERLRKELEIGRRIQRDLLPQTPLRSPFAEIGGLSVPAREVGGDFFNYFPLRDGEVAVLLGDVSGKGVGAALLMANLQATLRARLSPGANLAELVDALDREMESDTPLAAYVTLFLAVLEGRDGRAAIRQRRPQHAVRASVGGRDRAPRLLGAPPGSVPGWADTSRRALVMGDGDALFLFTDGIVEAEDESGEPFGMERLEAVLGVHRGDDLDGLLGRVHEAVRSHRGPARGRGRRDDARPARARVPTGAAGVKRDLAALAAAELDLVVVGGGVYGAVAAWDAAQRGLSVALVERDDFGSGASWHSLKTIHGGMRYLQKAALGRLRESARERRTFLAHRPRARPSAALRRPHLRTRDRRAARPSRWRSASTTG